MSDFTEDPGFAVFVDNINAHLLPKLRNSALTLSIVPAGETDVKFAIELGLSIMLDKPIVALVQPGTKVSSKLVAVADRIIEVDFAGDDTERVSEAITAAIKDLDLTG